MVELDKCAYSFGVELCFAASIVCKYKYVIIAAGKRVEICMLTHDIVTSVIMSVGLCDYNN